jgi:CheY-like chemotaxis protein
LNTSLEEKIRQRTMQLGEINQHLVKEIDRRKEVEEDLLKTVGIAEKANQAKSEFLSRMSHELRTPMNAILGYAQLMNFGDLNPAHRKGVDHILRSGKHLLGPINEVLDIAEKRPNIRLFSEMYGRNAVALAIEHRPDVIFLDLNLPDMDGFEVLGMLREEQRTTNIPVIVISADAMPHKISRLMEAGAQNYFTKPIDILALLNEVDKWTTGKN